MSRAAALLLVVFLFPSAVSAENTDSRLALRDYAECVVSKLGPVARQAVLEDWSNQTLVEKGVSTPRCIRRSLVRMQLRTQGPLMKFAIGEALLNKEGLALDAGKARQVPALTYRMPPPIATHYPRTGKPLPPKALQEETRGHMSWLSGVALAQFGECVVRADPSASGALLKTTIGKPDELAAIQRLSDAMRGCVSSILSVNLNRSSIRGPIAAATYRMASALNGSSWIGDAPAKAQNALKGSR